jgi:hypothetical protein
VLPGVVGQHEPREHIRVHADRDRFRALRLVRSSPASTAARIAARSRAGDMRR